MTTATTTPSKITTDASVNEAAKVKSIPKVKQEIIDQASRLRAAMVLDTRTNVIDTPQAAIDTELEAKGYSREGLTKMANDLHALSSSHTLAAGNMAHDHWLTQKAEERGPVVAPTSMWDGQSITSTHIPVSVERVVGKDETTTVYGQVNMHQATSFARNTGSMSAVRQTLRNNAAASFNK